ncbi:MAG: PKD domain-containing protein [Thermoplasmatota archaeon]
MLALSLLLLAPALAPPVSGVYLGPRVIVNVGSTNLDEGASTVVYVTVYNETGVKVSGATVNIEAELGSFDRSSAQTGSQGVANFVYTAPRDIPEARSVRINATAVYDMPPFTTGFATVWVRTVARLGIDGPDVVLAGGGTVRYIAHAINGSSPVSGASVFVEAPDLGTVLDFRRVTDENGAAWVDYQPPASETGEAVLSIRVQPETGAPITGSKTIRVVAEILNMTVSVSTDRDPLPCWGSCNLTATVMKGGEPVPNATVTWLATQGWRSASSTLTDVSGRARIIYTASNSSGSLWAGPVTVQVTATRGGDTARTNLTFQVAPYSVGWSAELTYSSTGSQLLPGERLEVNLSLRLAHGRPWEFITPVSIGLRLWSYNGTTLVNRTVGQGISIVPGLDWRSQELELLTIPDPPTGNQYYWTVKISSELGGFVYYELPQPVHVQALSGRGEWTFLEYVCDKNNLMPQALRQLGELESAAPEGECQYLVEYAGADYITSRCSLAKDTKGSCFTPENVSTLGNIDMANPEALRDFLAWGAAYAPAENYCIIIYDHGGGWEGVCWQGREHITLSELEDCMQDFRTHARKPQVLVFNTCLMSSAEAMYRLRDDVNYIVASETVICTRILTSTGLGRILSHYPPAPEQLCRDILYGALYLKWDLETGRLVYTEENKAVAAVSIESAGEFFNALDDFCLKMMDDQVAFTFLRHAANSWAYVQPHAYDLERMLTGLDEALRTETYLLDHLDVRMAVENVLVHFNNMFVGRRIEGDYAARGLGGLNIMFTGTQAGYMSVRDEYVHDAVPSDFAWMGMLERFYCPPGGESAGHILFPTISGFNFDPIEDIVVSTSDSNIDGLVDNLTVGIGVNNTQNDIGFFIALDLYTYNDTLRPAPSNLGMRRVLQVRPGEQFSTNVELTSPEEDFVDVALTLIAPGGRIIYTRDLDRLTMSAGSRSGSAPELSISASELHPLEGRPVTFTAAASDADGDELEIWWDFDDLNPLGLDASGANATFSYRGTGKRTATCIASDGSHVVVRELGLNVSSDPENHRPLAYLSFEFAGPNTVVLNASGSTDPDSDPLEFLFVLGDGNWTDWTAEPRISHKYRNGSYECLVMVRDRCAYNGSSTYTALNVTGGPLRPANSPPVARLAISPQVAGAKKPVIADASGSSDPDNDALQYRFDWGDGNSTDWSGSPIASHVYARDGKYNVTLLVRDPGNLTDSASATVNVTRGPGEVVARGLLPGMGAWPALAAALGGALVARRRACRKL